MATIEKIILTDSLDERIQNGVETVTFYHPVTGAKLDIELGEQNRKHFANHLEKLDKYLDAARVVEDEKPAKKAAKADGELAKIRKWAQDNGYAVGDRGRIKSDIVEAYRAAQSALATPDTDAQAAGDEPVALVESEATASVALDGETQVVDNNDQLSDDEILAMMAEIEAEKGDVELADLQAKLDNE